MAYVNNNKVSLGSSYNYGVAIREIAALLGVDMRSDGKFYLADMCVASSINKWAKYKPIPLKDSQGNDVTDNAYTKDRYYTNGYSGSPDYRNGLLGNVLSYNNFLEVAGMDIPLIWLNTSETIDNQSETIVSTIENFSSNGKNWEKVPWSRRGGMKRIRDFDGYNANAIFPLVYSIDQNIAMDALYSYAGFAHNPSSDADDSVSVQDIFSSVFKDDFYLAAVFVRGRSSTSVGYQEVVVSSTPMSAVGGNLQIPSTMLLRLASIRCYFFAYNPTKMLAIPLPTSSTYTNPQTTKVTEYANADPFPKLSQPYISSTEFTDVFGYNVGTGAANMINMRDASPSGTVTGRYKYAPSTTGPMIISLTIKNVAANNATLTINPLYFRLAVSVNNSSSKQILTPTVYNSSLTQITSSFTLTYGSSVKLYLYVSNIWSGQSVTASDTTSQFLTIQPTYYNAAYANYGYPTSYPNMGGYGLFAYYPASSSHDNKVAVLSGTTVTFKSYSEV